KLAPNRALGSYERASVGSSAIRTLNSTGRRLNGRSTASPDRRSVEGLYGRLGCRLRERGLARVAGASRWLRPHAFQAMPTKSHLHSASNAEKKTVTACNGPHEAILGPEQGERIDIHLV